VYCFEIALPEKMKKRKYEITHQKKKSKEKRNIKKRPEWQAEN